MQGEFDHHPLTEPETTTSLVAKTKIERRSNNQGIDKTRSKGRPAGGEFTTQRT
jgi:hypothetical protein